MNFKTTLVLLILLAGVGAFFLFVERSREPGADDPAEVAEAEGQPLLGDAAPDREAVRQVAVRRDGERVVLFREPGGWWQVEPVRFAVEEASAEGIVEQALGLRWRQRFEPGAADQPTLDDVGLATPRAEVTLTAGEQVWALRLGRRTLDGSGYLQVNDDKHVYVVDDGLHQAVLDETIRDWRRKTLQGPRSAQTQRLTVEQGDETIELVKQDGRWYLDSEQRERASQQQVQELVDAVQSVSIASFVADSPERLSAYGLHEPRTQITLETAELGEAASETGRHFVLRIGAAADLADRQHYATWSVDEQMSPVVFTIAQRGVDRLATERGALRDPRIVTTAANDVAEVHVERAAQPPLHLVRDVDRGFVFGEGGPTYAVDYNAASELAEGIARTQATGYVSDFEPAADPVAEVTLTRRGGRTEQVRLYEDPGPETVDADGEGAGEPGVNYLAVREDESVAYRIPGDRLPPLFAPLTAFRDMELMNVPSSEVAGVTLERDDGVTFVFTRDGDTWQLAGHDAFERRAFEGLLGSLRPLRAANWLDEPLTVGEGGNDGWTVLTVEGAEGSSEVLHVDVDRRAGMLADGDMAFELPRTFVERLQAEYRPRTVLSMPQDEIEQIRREQDGETLTLRRTSSGQYLSDADAPVREQPAAALFDTLSSLQVWRYIDEPAGVDGDGDEGAGGPERQYVIEPVDGEPYTLELWRLDHGVTVGRLGERWFVLDGETLDVLYDSLLEDEQAVEVEQPASVPERAAPEALGK